MAWVPAGAFRMGSDRHYPRRRPCAASPWTGSGSTAARSRTGSSPTFVEATGYVTVAERPLDPREFPGAPAGEPRAGLARVHDDRRPRRPAPPEPVVDVDARGPAGGARTGPGTTLGRARGRAGGPRRASRTPRRTRPGPGSRSRPRPSGSARRAAASTARPTSGATSPSRRASGSRTTGTATFPWRHGRGLRRAAGRSARIRRTARPPRHGRERLGVDGRLVRRAAPPGNRSRHAACRTTRAAATLEASYDPAQPQFRDPAQGDQGRLLPLRRQLLPPLPARRASPADGRRG